MLHSLFSVADPGQALLSPLLFKQTRERNWFPIPQVALQIRIIRIINFSGVAIYLVLGEGITLKFSGRQVLYALSNEGFFILFKVCWKVLFEAKSLFALFCLH